MKAPPLRDVLENHLHAAQATSHQKIEDCILALAEAMDRQYAARPSLDAIAARNDIARKLEKTRTEYYQGFGLEADPAPDG